MRVAALELATEYATALNARDGSARTPEEIVSIAGVFLDFLTDVLSSSVATSDELNDTSTDQPEQPATDPVQPPEDAAESSAEPVQPPEDASAASAAPVETPPPVPPPLPVAPVPEAPAPATD